MSKFETGNKLGNRFTSKNQPSSEAKRNGHKKKKALDELKNEICETAFNLVYDKIKHPEELTNKEIIDIFKQAVKMSGFLKQDINTNNQPIVKKVFVTPEDIAYIDELIDRGINN